MRRSVILITLFMSAGSLYAQSAEEVVSKYIEQLGGRAKLATLASIKMEGKASINGMEFPITVLSKGKTKLKTSFSFQGTEIVQPACTDGELVWNTNPTTMKNELLGNEAAEAIKRETKDFPDPLFTFKTNGYTIEKGEDEAVSGSDCFKITLVKPDAVVQGSPISGRSDFFINKADYKLVKKSQSTPMGAIETYLTDYQDIEGLQYAFKMETKIGGNTISTINFEKIETNVGIDDLLFTFPE